MRGDVNDTGITATVLKYNYLLYLTCLCHNVCNQKLWRYVVARMINLYALIQTSKLQRPFLALIHYVIRAHGIKICPSSVVRPSVVCVVIISEPHSRISFKFQLLVALDPTPGTFWTAEKSSDVSKAFPFSLTWNPMRAKFAKRYFSLKSLSNNFQTNPEFSSQ